MAEPDVGVAPEEFDDECYSYRKYGAKGPTQTRYSTRHYFKCNHDGCSAKKIVEITPGQPPKTELTGHHNHPPDANKSVKRRARDIYEGAGDGSFAVARAGGAPAVRIAAAPAKPEETKSKRASAQRVSGIIQLVLNGGHDPEEDGSPPPAPRRPTKAPPVAAPRPAKRPQPDYDYEVPGLDLGMARTADSLRAPDKRQAMDHAAPEPAASIQAPMYAPKMEDESGPMHVEGGLAPAGLPTACLVPGPAVGDVPNHGGQPIVGHDGVPFEDHRLEVADYTSNTGVLSLIFDGLEHEYKDAYAWRKYGKKEIKGCSSNCPRYYWRCTNKTCDIKRHTQATADGYTEVKYYGAHSHAPPPLKAGGRRQPRAAAPQHVVHDGSEAWEDNHVGGSVLPWAAERGRTSKPSARVASQYRSEYSEAASPVCSQGSQGCAATDTSSIATSSMKRTSGNVGAGEGPGHQNAALAYQSRLLMSDTPRFGPVNERCPLFFLACVAANEPLPRATR